MFKQPQTAMRHYLPLLAILAISLIPLSAAQDSLVMGPNYANQVWYSLITTNKTTAPQQNWDLAFEMSGFTGSVRINEGKGAMVYVVPEKTVADWASIDTTGLNTWSPLNNDASTWSVGALNRPADASDEFDLGWGSYNMQTHQIEGTRVYVYKSPTTTRKLRIDALAGGTYTFTYANIDGSDEHSGTIAKADFTGKAFGYWNIDDHTSVDREPKKDEWDLTMLHYFDMVTGPGGTVMPYKVSGILLKGSTKAVKAVGADPYTIPLPSVESFDSTANVIGYDWKSYSGQGYVIADSTAYFVKSTLGTIYRIVLTGFSGGSTGTTTFTSDAITTSVNEESGRATLGIYPNVVTRGTTVNVVSDTPLDGRVLVVDAAGRVVHSVSATQGFTVSNILTENLTSGRYTIVLETDLSITTSAFIVH